MSWEKGLLKNISVVDWGNTDLTKKSFSEDGEFLGVSAAGVDGKMNHYEHEYGTLVISAIGANCGKLFFPSGRFTAIKNTITITPKRNLVHPKYLFYYLNDNDFRRRGAGQPFISKGDTELIEIPLPPLPIQQKIAAILDQADALRKKDQQLLAKYDELLQAVFYDMFGDPVKNEKGWEKLNGDEYSEKISVGVVIQPASYYVEKGVIALRSLNIRPNKIVLENLVHFSEEANKNQLHKSILKENDVVIVRTGATGTAAVVPKELDGCNCIDLIIVRPDKNIINSIYLSLFFNSDFGKNIVSGKEVGGIQKHFNIGAIKSLKIPIPPIKIQTRFAIIVKNIQQQKEQVKQQTEHSENLFQSLLQRAFKGELVKKN